MGVLKSINYWSFPGGLDGAADIRYVLEKAKGYGYDAVELCIGLAGQLTPDTTRAECEAILSMASEIGIKVASVASGIYWAYNLASEAEADRVKAVDTLKKMVRVTSWLGCKTLLTIPGAVDIFFDPFTYARFDGYRTLGYARAGLGVLDLRARNADTLDQIERTSIDYYATQRSLYRQYRNSEIRNGETNTEELPNL